MSSHNSGIVKLGLFLTARPTDGGAFQFSQSVVDAVANLPQDRYESTFFFVAPDWEEHLKRTGVRAVWTSWDLGSRFYDFFWRRIAFPTGVWRSLSTSVSPLAAKMVAEKRDLWIFPAQDSFAYQVPVPSLGVIYDLMHRYEPSFPEVDAWGRAKRRDRHYRDLGRYSRGILVDSEIGKKQAIESYGIPPGRLHVLPYVAPWYVDSVSGRDLPKDKNLPRKYIFYPAQFWKHKNHGRLIEAVARLKPGLPDLRLVLAGARKNGYKDILELCRRKGVEDAVIFLGYVPEAQIPGLYRHARALVFPSFFGPTNIPPLEAFAMGCPVACSNVYGMPEQLGDAALMFSPNSVDEIATAIERVWTDDQLCARLAEKGRARSAAWGRTQFQAQFRVILGTILAQSC